MGDPTAYLIGPAAPDESVSNGFANPVDIFNYVSPAAWINDAIETAVGFDIIGWCVEWLTGDWEAIYKFGDALISLAECLQEQGINIQQAALAMDASWDGNAADAAYQYFSSLATATSGQQIALREIGENYHKAALGAWQLSNQLGNIIQALADKAIIAGIIVAGSTATTATGVGAAVGAVGYGIAALQAVEMLSLANKASTIINTGGSVILGVFGTGMQVGYQGGSLTGVPLPSTAYAAPGA
ncbi:hypothetical protein [Actinoplanes sp. RD1]|uniref:hypothetical protein n=1 Tax=Actinoplanes sp. RD1 TaxID=3064538 RepID=UPI0027425DFB|nr:hypothetical protein [Actinoplanes sp. RD1]